MQSNSPKTHTFKEISNGVEMVSIEGGLNQQSSDLKWSNINFKVGSKPILTECWGAVPAGTVCAIMGPSGAGKSSLLNVLAGRSASGNGIQIDGKVTVGGVPINPVAFRKNIAYVMQEDALLATATPREALHFSASMRLPLTTTKEQIDEKVDRLLTQLGLTDCSDVLIGGALIKGISGGQRKRTSVGVEIITDPKLLFLDEPTSGLDSYSAFNCISLLKKLSQENCAILCTIHQPSSEVFFLFDKVIYLKDGLVFYQGPVDMIVDHFSRLGFQCPDNYNPSDFVMNLCSSDTLDGLRNKGLMVAAPPEFSAISNKSNNFDTMIEFTVNRSLTSQIYALTKREVINVKRDTAALVSRFGITIILNLLFGLIFYQDGRGDNSINEDFQAHVGSISMVMILALFASAQSIMLSFPFERPLFLREYSTGTFGVFPYFISKLSMEIPLTFAQNIVGFLLTFFLIGFRGNYIYLVLIGFGLGLTSNSVACCLGAAVPDVRDVTELAPLLFVPQLLFAGFFIRTQNIPVFLRWAQYLCGMKYAMNLFLINEFDLKNPTCEGDAVEKCSGLLVNNNIETDKYYIYIILLFVLFFGFRVIAGFILVEKAKKFY